MVASGCMIFLFVKRRLVKKKMSSMKNQICKIKKRNKKPTSSPTIESRPKIEETIEETPPSKVKMNEDPTPKRSNLRNLLDGWKRRQTAKKTVKSETKSTEYKTYSMFDEFKDSPPRDQTSRNDSIESRKFDAHCYNK